MVVPFLDYGRSWDDIDTDPNPLRNTDDAKYIIGLGLGLIWEPIDGLHAQIFWGADVGDNFEPGDDPRDFRDTDLQDDGIHISVTYMTTW
jgi:hemolysin activation/secretion protein